MTTAQQTAADLVLVAMDVEDRSHKWTADRAGISYPTFKRRLAGGGDFTVGEVARIARALGKHPSELLPEEFKVLAAQDAA